MYISPTGGQEFLNSVHGQLECISCHGGQEPAMSMEEAHLGIVRDPSSQPDKYCAGCHADIVSKFMNSIHLNQSGYHSFFNLRYSGNAHAPLDARWEAGFEEECAKCHATCGQCHISMPLSVRSGLVSGHRFNRTPDMTKNCTACHGSRIGDEYLGNHEGIAADVHWLPNARRCEFCHKATEMHGSDREYTHKLEVESMPRCENCHSSVQGSNPYHQQHWGELSCGVCHSQPYRNCNACHVGGAGITGSSYLTFKIGKNPVPDLRPYKWVTLRHIPIAPDTYADWGITDLPFFNIMPTWKYTQPHNVIKNTPQTAPDSTGYCGGNCHHNEDIFLRPADLLPGEEQANDPVVVKDNEWPVGP